VSQVRLFFLHTADQILKFNINYNIQYGDVSLKKMIIWSHSRQTVTVRVITHRTPRLHLTPLTGLVSLSGYGGATVRIFEVINGNLIWETHLHDPSTGEFRSISVI
jgi:hypothetical protein